MWENIEREFDGVVGRMLSWLTHPPVRPLEDLEEPAGPLSAPVTETVSERVEDAAETLQKAAGKAAETTGKIAKAAGKAAGKAAETTGKIAQAVAETAEEVAEAVTEMAEKVNEAVVAAAEGISEDAAEATDAARRGEALIEAELELDAAVVEPQAGEGDELEDRLLAALAAAPAGASMKQLEKATGGKPRQRLKQLVQAGRVERKAVGMKTFYHLAEG